MSGNINTDSPAEANKRFTRRDREKQQRRYDILRAAEAIFATKPYHAASLDDVAKVAEYAKGTIYLYFENKEALYAALYEEKTEQMLGILRDEGGGTKDFAHRLTSLVRGLLDFSEKNAWFFRIFTQEGMDGGGGSEREHWERVQALHREYLVFITEVMEAGLAEGRLRAGDPRQYALALGGVVGTVIRAWLERKSGDSLLAQGEFITDFFLHGAGAARG